MKSIISGAVMVTAIAACLTLNVQAKSFGHLPAAISAVSDTGKMDKMKMDKMDKMKMSKMSKDKMKMARKMDKKKGDKMKMAKDTGKM